MGIIAMIMGLIRENYLISRCTGDDAILIKAKDKATAEALKDNIKLDKYKL